MKNTILAMMNSLHRLNSFLTYQGNISEYEEMLTEHIQINEKTEQRVGERQKRAPRSVW